MLIIILSDLIGWRKKLQIDKFHEQESRNYFPSAGSWNCNIKCQIKYDIDDKVGITMY